MPAALKTLGIVQTRSAIASQVISNCIILVIIVGGLEPCLRVEGEGRTASHVKNKHF